MDDRRRNLTKSKTLLDIIGEEKSGTAYKDLVDRYVHTKNKTKSIKDRLLLRRSASTRTSSPTSSPSSQPIPSSDVPLPSNRRFQRTQSSASDVPPPSNRRFQRTQSTASFRRSYSMSPGVEEHEKKETQEDEEEAQDEDEAQEEEEEANVIPPAEEDEEGNGGRDGEEERNEDSNSNVSSSSPVQVETPPAPVTMSLMDLLDMTGGAYLGTEDEEEEEEVEEEKESGEEEGGQYVCCVCMVRHKGAAFIPCGHTFCRVCSRELWVSRGNCPLCNAYILEILHIF